MALQKVALSCRTVIIKCTYQSTNNRYSNIFLSVVTVFNILLKKVLHLHLKPPIPLKSRNMMWPSSHFQRMFSVPCLFKTGSFERWQFLKNFVQNKYLWFQNSKITLILCYDKLNIFSIIVWSKNRSTEGCSKLKNPETRQVQEKLVSTLEHLQVPKWDRTRCPEK